MNKTRVIVALLAGLALSGAVRAEVARIEITPGNPTLNVGDTKIFTAQGYDENDDPCTIDDPHWEGDGTYGTITPDPQDPTKCSYTANSQGSGYIMCYNGPPGQAPIHGSTDITIDEGGSELDRIEVTPENSDIHLGESITFSAKGFNQSGGEVPIEPVWSTDGGTITQGGEYTATEAGNFTVTASIDGSPVTGTADVHVGESIISRIEITPGNPTLNVGDTKIFTAQGYDENDDEVPISPLWSTDGGTITPEGQYTATGTGSFTVEVGVAGSTVTGQATVVVTAPSISGLTPGAPLRVAFQSYATTHYTLQRRVSLTEGDWQDVTEATNVQGTGDMMELSDPAPPAGGICFYRLVCTVSP